MTDNSYSVADLMFATLHQLVGPDEFNRIVGGYYQEFPNGGTNRDFVAFARRTSSRDLAGFFDDWVLTPHWSARVAHATWVSDRVAGYAPPH